MILVKFGILVLNIIYFFIKLFPQRKRITFISRQSNKKSDDISLLEKEIKKRDSSIDVVVLCKKIEKGLASKVKYFFHMFKQMYYLSTSKVIILDGYCICASVLKKKKNTTIIQMWHALGAFKKFGLSIIDSEEGTSSKLSKVMKMHKNYDYILTSSSNTRRYFKDAFGYNINRVIVMPLPRVDYLTDKKRKKEVIKKVIKRYPQCKNKKNIIYVPTFRKGIEDIDKINELINCIDYSKYNLIIKPHPLSNIKIKDERVICDKYFSSIDMITMGDYVITDYSAIVFEASILEKPLFFYCYDYDKYYRRRNFYINYKEEMPGIITDDAKEIVNSIENNQFDLDRVERFRDKYIELNEGKCTSNLVDFIFKFM